MRPLFKFSAMVSPLILSLLLPASAAEPATTPAVGAKAVIRANVSKASDVSVEADGAFADFDTPDDYNRLLRT